MIFVLLGIAAILVGWLVPVPYPLGIILIIVGVLALVYGLYLTLPRDRWTRRR